MAPYFILVVAVAVAVGMRARFMGDTVDYAAAAFSFTAHSWDFGHLLWQPTAWLARTYGELDTAGVIRVLLVFNAIAYISTALLMWATLNLLNVSRLASTIAVLVLLFSQAVLNYGLTGCSYVPGLTLTVLALYLALLRPTTPVRTWLFALGSGAAMAGAISLWFPYVLVVPGVLLAPLVLRGPAHSGIAFLLRAGIALGITLLVAYGLTAYLMGVRDIGGLRAWAAASSHNIETNGAARMIFGLARSFMYMGDDGLLFKRYLLNDPYNPVSLTDLLGLSLWKLALFYLVLVGVAFQLLRDAAGRRLALVALIGGLPVVIFGLFWQGGDMERYLPLYPFFFLALASAWDAPRRWPGLRTLLVLFCAVVVSMNGYSHSRWQVGLYQNSLTDRVRDLRAEIKPGSVLVVIADRLKVLSRDFPLETAGAGLDIHEIVTPGLTTSDKWRAGFAALALRTWDAGGDVWISRRLFAAAPNRDSTWAEGDDERLKWADFPAFVAQWEIDENVDASFVRLRRTNAQQENLQEMATVLGN